jgi:hypothetical protein
VSATTRKLSVARKSKTEAASAAGAAVKAVTKSTVRSTAKAAITQPSALLNHALDAWAPSDAVALIDAAADVALVLDGAGVVREVRLGTDGPPAKAVSAGSARPGSTSSPAKAATRWPR